MLKNRNFVVAAVLGAAGLASTANAGLVNMDFTDLTPTGIISFNGTNFLSTGVIAPYSFGNPAYDIPHSQLTMTGFQEVANQTLILDSAVSPNGFIDNGDDIIVRVTGGTFVFTNTDTSQVILSGSFSSGIFTTSVGGTSGAFTTTAGLTMAAGPAFPAAYTLPLTTPFGYGFNLSTIPAISYTTLVPINPGFLVGDLNAFGSSAGSVNISAQTVLVPEPTSLSAVGLAGLALGLRRRRRRTA